MDFIDLLWKPEVSGQSLNIMVQPESEGEAVFQVQIINIQKSVSGILSSSKQVQVLPAQLLSKDPDGTFTLVVPASELSTYNRIGVVITRVDANEVLDPIGAYSLAVRPVN